MNPLGWLRTRLARACALRRPRWKIHRIQVDLAKLRLVPTDECDPRNADPQPQEAPWSEVAKVSAYKRDLFTVDQICLLFETARGPLEVNDDMMGWTELLEALPDRLPGFPPVSSWFSGVAYPAFVENCRVLYERAEPRRS